MYSRLGTESTRRTHRIRSGSSDRSARERLEKARELSSERVKETETIIKVKSSLLVPESTGSGIVVGEC